MTAAGIAMTTAGAACIILYEDKDYRSDSIGFILATRLRIRPA
jgi:hypothetical protein